MASPQKNSGNNNLLLQYFGFAMQLIIALGIAVYAGIWLDKWIKAGFPLFVWVLPLLIIIVLMYKAIKDTSNKQ